MTPQRLACPKCRRTVPEVYWQGVDIVRCPACSSEFEQVRFPALAASRRVDRAARTASGEAACYFHLDNRAETACDGCGRYVCAVCRVPVAGQHFCPSCLENRADRRKLPENHRVLYDQIALLLAIGPLIMWPVTLLTAPATLGLVIYSWKKPSGLISKWRRTRLGVAGTLATIQVGAWLFVFGAMLLA